MIGGSPIQQPAFVPAYAQPYPNAVSQQYSTISPGGSRNTTPKLRVRGQIGDAPEESAPHQAQPLKLPTPEQVGISAKKRVAEVNWDDVRQRLQRLKIASFHLQKLPNAQGFRFICALPGGPGKQVQAEALTESEAIDQALAQAEIMQ
jgi:hypothetical protein